MNMKIVMEFLRNSYELRTQNLMILRNFQYLWLLPIAHPTTEHARLTHCKFRTMALLIKDPERKQILPDA